MNSPIVKVQKLDDEFVEMRLNKNSVRECKVIIDKLVKYHISTLIGLHMPEIYQDFPDGMPSTLQYKGRNSLADAKPVRVKKERGTKLLEEATSFIKEEPEPVSSRKRSSRFTGSYVFDPLLQKPPPQKIAKVEKVIRKRKPRTTSEASVSSLASSSGSQTVKPIKLQLGRGANPVIKHEEVFSSSSSSSDSSSDSSDSEAPPAPQNIPYQVPIQAQPKALLFPPAVTAPNLSESSSSEDEKESKVSKPSVFTAPKPPVLTASKPSVLTALKPSVLTASKPSVLTASSKPSVLTASKPSVLTASKFQIPLKSDITPVATTTKLQVNSVASKPLIEVKKSPEKNVVVVQVKESKKLEEKEIPIVSKPQIINVPAKPLNGTQKSPQKKARTVNGKSSKPSTSSEAKKSYAMPQVIEAPMINPRTKKPINKPTRPALNKPKLKAPENELRKLGGIFDIDNGWDKQPEKKIPRIPKIREPPKIDVLQNDGPDYEEAHNVYFSGFGLNVNNCDAGSDNFKPPERTRFALKETNMNSERDIIRPNRERINFDLKQPVADANDSTKRDKFNRRDTDDESESDDEIAEPVGNKATALCESESEEEEIPVNGNNESEESEDEMPAAKRRKVVFPSDDEENDVDMLNNDDVLSVGDDDNLDDLVSEEEGEEYLPPKSHQKQPRPPPKPKEEPQSFTSELDGLNMKFTKEKVKTAEEIQEEFDRNTALILKNMPKNWDDVTEQALKKFFFDMCESFIDSKDCDPNKKCKLKHEFLPIDEYRKYFEKTSLNIIDEFYALCVTFPRLFDFFFALIADLYVIKTNAPELESTRESKLSQMILHCEKTARSHSNYHHIVESLAKTIPRYKAIMFVIKHHTPSPVADELILQMVVDTGPDMVRFMVYLKSVQQRRTLPTAALDKIISNCITFQNPYLPLFCLNNLVTRSLEQLRQLEQKNVVKLLELQTVLNLESQNCEAKLESIALMITKRPRAP